MAQQRSYTIIDTGQTVFYDNTSVTTEPAAGTLFYGQDATYDGNQASYVDNGNGTVSDLNTGLMWTAYDTGDMTWADAVSYADSLVYGGYDDWRLPTIKELYSLIDFSGYTGTSEATSSPYIDTAYFDFVYGDTASGERYMDAQYWTLTTYTGTTMGGNATTFGVNFADGRIKGYPSDLMTASVFLVRGNDSYGENQFYDNGDGTITDEATGLMWSANDSGYGMDWQTALAYAEASTLAGYTDWTLPNAKELQSIVDYDQSPDALDPTKVGPAIDDTYFTLSNIGTAADPDYGYYWTGTTHVENDSGDYAVYLSLGTAWGYMDGSWMDVHGAGAQRSDPKFDDGSYPEYWGPQGDLLTIDNYVLISRAVADDMTVSGGDAAESLAGNTGNDLIQGGNGGDVIYADSGRDTVIGGDGGDSLSAGAGGDVVVGQQGNDTIDAGAGDDTVHGGLGSDYVVGGNYDDVIHAGQGNDWSYGDEGNDWVSGGFGHDVLSGGAGSDALLGGGGGDYLWGGAGSDQLAGGSGADRFAFSSGDGHDNIADFSAAEGDRLVVWQGATVTTSLTGAGNLVVDFGGSAVTLIGVTSFSSSWLIYQ